jgi:hypothetical protein
MIENPDKEVLAAEYVLGTLGLAERVQVQQMIASDATFASLVRDWERRLGELNVLVTPVEPPPAILEWIKARHASGDAIRDVFAEEPPPAAAEPAPTIVPPVDEPPAIAPVAADVPGPERTRLEVLRTETPLFEKLIESRRNRREDWYRLPAGKIEICNVPIPVRSAGVQPTR